MARARSTEKRDAILHAAVEEIAASGLAATTANIAGRAGVATGSLFLYFATKEHLLNELYLDLKREMYKRIHADFPVKASLEQRLRHIWTASLEWSIDFPARRKVSLQLAVSDLISPESRTQAAEGRGEIERTLNELEGRNQARNLPAGFASAIMSAMGDATIEFVARQPEQGAAIVESAFLVFWRAVR